MLLTSPSAQRNLDPTLPTLETVLLRIWEGHGVRLDVGMLDLADTDVVVAIITNDLEFVIITCLRVSTIA